MTAGITLVAVALVGALLGEWIGDRFKQHMPLLLSFGGAFLLGLCFLHLLPEAFAMNATAGQWVIAGFLLQIGLEYMSKGMEHGHVHGSRFGLLAFLSLCLHALIEAMPFGLDAAQMAHDHLHDHGHDHGHHHHHHVGEGQWALLAGIALHKLPVALALATILKATVTQKSKRWAWILFFAATPVFGMLIAGALPQVPSVFGALNGILVGILLHISTTILFETADGHDFNARKLATILGGLLLSWLASPH
jgi:hypothetical protein